MGTEICTIIAGPSQKLFVVHRQLVYDEIINSCEKVTMKDGVMCIEWLNKDEDAFELLVYQMYHGIVPLWEPAPGAKPKGYRNQGDAAEEHIEKLLKLFILVEGYGFEFLMDQTMDAIWTSYRKLFWPPKTETMVYCYQMTPKGSPLRLFMSRYLTCIFCNTCGIPGRAGGGRPTKEIYAAMVDCNELAEDVIEQSRGAHFKTVRRPTEEPVCRYYAHEVREWHANLLNEFKSNDCSSEDLRHSEFSYVSEVEEDEAEKE